MVCGWPVSLSLRLFLCYQLVACTVCRDQWLNGHQHAHTQAHTIPYRYAAFSIAVLTERLQQLMIITYYYATVQHITYANTINNKVSWSQRDHAMLRVAEYFAKSLKITQGRLK